MAIIAHSIGPRHTRATRNLFTRWWFWLIVAVVLVLVGSAAWIGTRALAAKAELEAAQAQVGQLKADAVAQKFSSLGKIVAKIEAHAANARDLTSDPVWRAAEAIPVAGKNLTVVRELAAVTDEIVTGTVAPLAKIASGLTPASFAPVNGAINLDPLTKAVPLLAKASVAVKKAGKTVDAIDTQGTIGAVAAAKAKIAGLITSVQPLLDSANTFLPLLPPFMGADAPRTYVVMFQNNAESRALGGTALSFATLSIDKGKVQLVSTVSAGFGHFSDHSAPVIPAPDGVESLYEGTFGRFIPNATVRPQFSSAAQIVLANWKEQFGTTPDGVISIDPVALSYVLRATSPVQLSSGDILTADSLVPFLLNTVYLRYNSGKPVADNAAQDVIYGEAVSSTFSKLSGGPLNPKLLVAALLQGFTEHRLNYYSTHPDEQAVLTKANLTGGLPASDAKTDRVGVYFQDNVGSKLNFYLNQTVHLGQAVCRADGRATYRVGVDLVSSVPVKTKTLSPSILGNWQAEKLKPGVQRLLVYVYAPPGSEIARATVGGVVTPLTAQHDEAYPVARLLVSVAPGATVSLAVDITALQAGVKALEARVTPMVHDTTMVATQLDCASVVTK